jgi:hypothetical protein
MMVNSVAAEARKLRIFVASLGDVAYERDQLARVVEQVNQILGALVPESGLVLELIRWETHVHPGLGRDAQAVVNEQLQIGMYDVFVGIFWSRFGTPTARTESGTEEEFRIAYEAWKRRGRAIQIMVYFCRSPAALPDDEEAVEQLGKVTRFRLELFREGLARDYDRHEDFADHVRRDLVLVLGQLRQAESPPASVVTRVTRVLSDEDRAATWQRIKELGGQYDKLRQPPPFGMLAGSERTRRMEVIASDLRSLALSSYPLLPELVASHSAGLRLAAVTALQAVPDPAYLEWLGARIEVEKPFIGYHAALALLSSARSVDIKELGQVRAAVDGARRSAQRLRPDTDRSATLELALDEINRRSRHD